MLTCTPSVAAKFNALIDLLARTGVLLSAVFVSLLSVFSATFLSIFPASFSDFSGILFSFLLFSSLSLAKSFGILFTLFELLLFASESVLSGVFTGLSATTDPPFFQI